MTTTDDSTRALADVYAAEERRRFEAGETTIAFGFGGRTVQALILDGEPWFIVNDIADVLGYSRGRDAVRMVDEQDVRAHKLRSGAGLREYSIINESGLYQMIILSRSEDAKAFRRWVTSEVLPAIRKTGRYAPTGIEPPKTFAQALRLAAEQQEALEAAEAARQAAEAARAALEAPARAWTTLGTGEGSWSMAEAAKILAQDHQIRTGQNRLFALLQAEGWIFRRHGEWEPYQSAVDAGWLVTKPQSYRLDDEKVILSKPQVRITPAGLERLLPILNPSKDLVQF